MSPDGRFVLCTGDSDSSLWHFPLREPDHVSDTPFANEVFFLGDRYVLGPARGMRAFTLRDLESGERLKVINNSMNNLRYAVSPNGQFGLVQVGRGEYHRFVVGKDGIRTDKPALKEWMFQFALDESGTRALATDNRALQIYDLGKQDPIMTLNAPRRTKCTALGFIDQGRHAIAVFPGPREPERTVDHLHCWDTRTGKALEPVIVPYPVSAMAISVRGAHFAIGGTDRGVTIFDRDLKRLGRFRALDGSITSMAFHPRLPILASGSDDMTIRLWSLEGGREISTILGPQGAIRSLAFDSSGKRLICSSHDRKVRIWELPDLK